MSGDNYTSWGVYKPQLRCTHVGKYLIQFLSVLADLLSQQRYGVCHALIMSCTVECDINK